MKSLIILLLPLLSCIYSCSSSKHAKLDIIPSPNQVTMHDGTLSLNSGMTVTWDEGLEEVADLLIHKMSKYGVVLKKRREGTVGNIYLRLGMRSENPEAYKVNISFSDINIRGSSKLGVLRGVSTLLQLGKVKDSVLLYPRCEIRDQPRFEYRGLHLDVSRHFFDATDVKQVLDYMFRYKLNKFHWHLTNDEGWRIQIEKYPLLTEIGAWRHFDSNDRMCQTLEKTMQDNNFRFPEKYLKINGSDTTYGGFYTQEDIREVLEYAQQRGIDVIPEINLPDHFTAALSAYPQFSCNTKGEGKDGHRSVLCIGNDDAINFVKDIYTEVCKLFPYQLIHIGGDDADNSNWSNCARCKARANDSNLGYEAGLKDWLANEINEHIDKLGKKTIFWDDVADKNIPANATIMWWRSWATQSVPKAGALGHNLIMSPCFTLYFNNWERSENLKNVYDFEPIPSFFDESKAKLVLGLQANLWTENITSLQMVQHQYIPRILALSEVGWTNPKNKDWESFNHRFINEIKFLHHAGINYHLPSIKGFYDINVFTDSTFATPYIDVPELEIRYTVDGKMPDANSTLYSEPILVNQNTTFYFKAFRPDRSGCFTYKAEFRKESPRPPLDVNPTRNGIFCKQYQFDGNDSDNIATEGVFKAQRVLDSITFPKQFSGLTGLVFDGYFEALTRGIYTFRLNSNDGSTMFIDDEKLIDNDSESGDNSFTAQIYLDKGLHKIRVNFFDMDNGGRIDLTWKTPTSEEFKTMTDFRY